MKEYKKEIIISGSVLIAVIIVIGLISLFKKTKVEAPVEGSVSILTRVEDKPAEVAPRKRKAAPVVDELNNISYTEAIMKYREGRLIQFSENCQSSPYRMVIANGSELMLDNRSENKEIISIGNTKHTLAPYGFKVIKVSEPTVPATHLIDCALSQNVNTLIVE